MKDLLWSTIKAFLNIFYFKAHWPSKNETVYWFPKKICGFPFVVVYITVSSNDFLRLILSAWNWDQIVVPLKSYPKAVTIIREFIATFCHSRTNWREIFIVSSALHRLTNGKRNTCCVVPQISLIREYLGGKWWQQYFIVRQKKGLIQGSFDQQRRRNGISLFSCQKRLMPCVLLPLTKVPLAHTNEAEESFCFIASTAQLLVYLLSAHYAFECEYRQNTEFQKGTYLSVSLRVYVVIFLA